MRNVRVWIEATRAGNLIVRSDQRGKRTNHYHVEKSQVLWVDTPQGKELKNAKWIAHQFVEKVKTKFVNEELGNYDLTLEVMPLIQEHLEEFEVNDRSLNTVRHKTSSFSAFLSDTRIKTLADFDRDTIKNWKIVMKKADLANETIRGRLSDVRRFANWLVEEGKLNVSPFGKKIMLKKLQSEPKYWSDAEYDALEAKLAEINVGARLGVSLAYSAGLRKAEFVGDIGTPEKRIQMEDITWYPDGSADLLIRREICKGKSKSRTIPLDAGVVALLGSRRSGPVVSITRNQMDHFFARARKLVQIEQDGKWAPFNPKLTIHGLRHTFAKNYLQRGDGNLRSLQELLGHTSIVTTQIYAQFEKAYFREGINKAYERRLVARAISSGKPIVLGVPGVCPSANFEGQTRGKSSENGGKVGT